MKINHAMFANQNNFNEFTRALNDCCTFNGEQLVMLRNKTYVTVKFHIESNSFHTENWSYCWNADGSSLTCDDYDIVAM
jgi:hypothetical protein